MTIQWVEYDGTAETLPPEDTYVILRRGTHMPSVDFLTVEAGKPYWYMAYVPSPGKDRWLPISTPEQLDAQAKRIAALEKVVEATRKINQDAWGLDEYDGYGIDDQDFVDLDTALANLDALGGAE